MAAQIAQRISLHCKASVPSLEMAKTIINYKHINLHRIDYGWGGK